MREFPKVLLDSGLTAMIRPDELRTGSSLLVVDGTPQSQVSLDQPTKLYFEYVRRIGNVIDLLDAPGVPITAVHIGAGALTLPRYLEATRPGSRQQVIELEPKLVDFVRTELPLPKNISLRIRYGDARAVVAKLPKGILGAVDLLVSDVFAGADTPSSVTSVEYYSLLNGLLKDDGIVLVNVADGGRLDYSRAQAATMAEVFPHLLILCDAGLLKGSRFGNLVIAASREAFPDDWPRLLAAAGPHPAKVMSGEELRKFAAAARAVTDNSPYQGARGIVRNFFDAQ